VVRAAGGRRLRADGGGRLGPLLNGAWTALASALVLTFSLGTQVHCLDRTNNRADAAMSGQLFVRAVPTPHPFRGFPLERVGSSSRVRSPTCNLIALRWFCSSR
jgi:hypothetical protein